MNKVETPTANHNADMPYKQLMSLKLTNQLSVSYNTVQVGIHLHIQLYYTRSPPMLAFPLVLTFPF